VIHFLNSGIFLETGVRKLEKTCANSDGLSHSNILFFFKKKKKTIEFSETNILKSSGAVVQIHHTWYWCMVSEIICFLFSWTFLFFI